MNYSPPMNPAPVPVPGTRFQTLRCPSCNLQESPNFFQKANGYIQCKTCGASFYDQKRRDETELRRNVRLIEAYDLIRTFRFQEAAERFQFLIDEDSGHEAALWGYLQACYGIVYLTGYGEAIPKPTFCFGTERRLPEFKKHDKYRMLMSLPLSEEEKAVYEEKANEIVRSVQSIKRELAKSIQYDVFICAKVSPINGVTQNAGTIPDSATPNEIKTPDCRYAHEIYRKLTAPADEGGKQLKVFFSDISRPQGINADWQIWSAMLRSKHILVIGTQKEHLESTWVMSEWRRWMYMVENDTEFSRDMTSFLTYIPDESWDSIRPDVWDLRRVQIDHTPQQLEETIRRLRCGGSAARSDTEPTESLDVAIRHIRARILLGEYESARAALNARMETASGEGELLMLRLRLNTLNFSDLSKITESEMDLIRKAFRWAGKSVESNEDWQEYQTARKTVERRAREEAKRAAKEAKRAAKEAKNTKQLAQEESRKSSVSKSDYWVLYMLSVECGLFFFAFLGSTICGFAEKIEFIPESGNILDSYWIFPFAMLFLMVAFAVLLTVGARDLYKTDKSHADFCGEVIPLGLLASVCLTITMLSFSQCADLIQSGQMASTFKDIFTSFEGIFTAIFFVLFLGSSILVGWGINITVPKTSSQASAQPKASEQPSLPSEENKTSP